jgi:predicted dehydrogenase
MPDTVRIGLVGFGNWPRHAHFPALTDLEVLRESSCACSSTPRYLHG